jgi:hypothetical protein
MLSRHRRKPCKKIIDRFARLEVIEQGLHGNSCPMEHGSAAHHVGAPRDNWRLHGGRLRLNGLDTQRWGGRTRAALGLGVPGRSSHARWWRSEPRKNRRAGSPGCCSSACGSCARLPFKSAAMSVYDRCGRRRARLRLRARAPSKQGHSAGTCDAGAVTAPTAVLRQVAGGTPKLRLKARLNAASDS